jgi:hypothetical protein
MEVLEISLLEQFGFSNPYLIADWINNKYI